jgi:hypothetical protein
MSRLASFLLFAAGIISTIYLLLSLFQPDRFVTDLGWHVRPAFQSDQAWKYGLLAILSVGFGGLINAVGNCSKTTQMRPETDSSHSSVITLES